MGSSIEIEEAAAEWLAKRDGAEWTVGDEAEFTQWLNASTANRVAFIRLQTAWQRANRLNALGAGLRRGVMPLPGEWRHSPFFRQPLPRPDSSARGETHRWQRRTAHSHRALAASVLVCAAIGLGWQLWPGGASYRTEVGGLAAVPMSDGSRITLNTHSEVRVAVSETERRVELAQGEAFFEVAKDPSRPFIVVAGDKRIVAIGTKFSVRREGRKSDPILVVVTEGRVRVESAARGVAGMATPPAEVAAGNIVWTGDAGVLIQEKPVDETEQILSWRRGYLVFRDTALADAVAEFNRYNTSEIVIEDAAVAGIRIGGTFRSTNVEAFVRLLEDGLQIRAEQRDERIVLTTS